MAFKTNAVAKSESTNKVSVNYEELNKFVVETAGLQDRENMVGYVVGIVDLGNQNMPDAEVVFTGSAQDEAEEIEKNSNTYFEDGFDPVSKKKVRFKKWPQKPIQCVAVAVEFKDVTIDKGQFFGKSNPQPLRLWLGGSFYIPGTGMVVGRPTPLKINKSSGEWSFDAKHLFYKMAVSSKLIKPGEPFLPGQIDSLLGKAFQFEAQVFFKESKGKQYYTEYVKFLGGLGRGQQPPEIESDLFLIEFDGDLTKEKMQNLRSHVINTIKNANNYDGSKIQEYLENESGTHQEETTDKPVSKVTPAKVKAKVEVDDLDDDLIPF